MEEKALCFKSVGKTRLRGSPGRLERLIPGGQSSGFQGCSSRLSAPQGAGRGVACGPRRGRGHQARALACARLGMRLRNWTAIRTTHLLDIRRVIPRS